MYQVFVHRGDYLDVGPFSISKRYKALVKGSWGSEIIDALKPKDTEIIVEKHRYSAFYNTDLEILLRGLGVTSLILTGIATNVCVESTARDAHSRDFEVMVITDCTASSDVQRHRASLLNMNEYFGKTLSLKKLLKNLPNLQGKI